MNHKDMQLVKIKALIANCHEIHGNNWSRIARAVQQEGHFTELDVRSLADKIRKSASCGALSQLNLRPPDNNEEESYDAVEEVRANPYTCEEDTKLRQLHNIISASSEGILKIAGFDPEEFRLESCKFQFWNVFCKSRRGSGQISELFSASVTAVPKSATADT